MASYHFSVAALSREPGSRQKEAKSLVRTWRVLRMLRASSKCLDTWLCSSGGSGLLEGLGLLVIFLCIALDADLDVALPHRGEYQPADVLEAFGRLNDGVSLYSAQLVTTRLYHLFAVYSWLQLLTGTAFTGVLMFFIRPALSDTETDAAPDAAPTIMEGASKATTKVAGAFV